jgi:hypothetical protein
MEPTILPCLLYESLEIRKRQPPGTLRVCPGLNGFPLALTLSFGIVTLEEDKPKAIKQQADINNSILTAL